MEPEQYVEFLTSQYDMPEGLSEDIVKVIRQARREAHAELVIALQALGMYAAALEMMLSIPQEGSALAVSRAAIAKATAHD